MINGVIHIVAAVLFAVVSLNKGLDTIWMGIAIGYLAVGIVNLVIHAVKVKKMELAAKKAETEKNKKDTAKAAEPVTTVGE